MTDDPAPTTAPEWSELREDAVAIAEEYRENDWDAVVVDPLEIAPSEDDDRFGFDVVVSPEEYDLLESLVADGDVTVDDAEVYYRPAEGADRRFALAVERDGESETMVCVPLTYAITDARPVLETALLEEELLVHVRSDAADTDEREGDTGERGDDIDEQADDPEQWVTFSHDDPSLFLEESDVRDWDLTR